ncbi:hypothetical protein [Sphingopyxis sp.]|nr:hypothetical protein [Sphingopyxis sp.]HET6523163.1 hypothetical protein [Sphingopyxis sp.]
MMFSPFLLATVVPAGQSFASTPVAVWDGDGRSGVRKVHMFTFPALLHAK